MILGMSTLTFIHVVLSLVGIAAGLIVLVGMLSANRLNGWTALFLTTTIATSATGFLFPFDRILPSHIVGIISLVALAAAVVGRYAMGLSNSGFWLYAVGALVALYLNIFVGVVQAFQKIAALSALAPTQSERPFVVAQAATLAVFVLLAIFAVRRFRRA